MTNFVSVYDQQMSFDSYVCVSFFVMTESSGIVCEPMRLFAFGWSITKIVDNFLEALAHLLLTLRIFLWGGVSFTILAIALLSE